MQWFKNLKKALKEGWNYNNDPADILPRVSTIYTNSNNIEKTIAELRLAIENEEFVFPEFSSEDTEKAKGLSLKALSITTRIFQLENSNAGED